MAVLLGRPAVPQFSCPSQQLPLTKVSVTADLLSHFDLIVASKGPDLKPLLKAIYGSPGMPEPAF